jgi:hypothetical protein
MSGPAMWDALRSALARIDDPDFAAPVEDLCPAAALGDR